MRRREFIKIIVGSAATWPLALAPECADAQYQRPAPPAPPHRSDTFTSDQVKREGYDYFGTASRGLAKVVEEAFSRWASQMAMSLDRNSAALSSPACATATARFTRGMRATAACSGKAPRSVTTPAAKAPER